MNNEKQNLAPTTEVKDNTTDTATQTPTVTPWYKQRKAQIGMAAAVAVVAACAA